MSNIKTILQKELEEDYSIKSYESKIILLSLETIYTNLEINTNVYACNDIHHFKILVARKQYEKFLSIENNCFKTITQSGIIVNNKYCISADIFEKEFKNESKK
jgi:hypothetical protein